MTLAEWMKEKGWSDQQMAEALGLRHRLSVFYYRNGKQVPRANVMRKILEVTGGAVTPNDLIASSLESSKA